MGRIQIIKKDGQAYLRLPSEFASLDELEFFPLRDGYYLLTVPLGEGQEARAAISSMHEAVGGGAEVETSNRLSEQEKLLLRNLVSIKFENRTPKILDKMLEDSEQSILTNLIKKGFVNVFKSKKYPDGVYNIKDEVYPILKGDRSETANPTKNESSKMNKEIPKTKETAKSNAPIDLNSLKAGYVIINDQKEAYYFSQEIKKSGRDKDVICLRAFDGKFYAVSKQYFSANLENLKSALKNENNLATIAKLCNIQNEGCRALLIVLADRGEVIEKRKDTFALV